MNIVLIVLLTIHKNIPFPLKIHHELLSTLKENLSLPWMFQEEVKLPKLYVADSAGSLLPNLIEQ